MRVEIGMRRGTTVIEVLVGASILLMLMGSLYLLMIAGLRYFMQGRAYQTVQQQSLVGLRRVLGELQNSRRSHFQYSALPEPHMVFLSAALPFPGGGRLQADPADGLLIWQKWVAYRVQGNQLQRDELVGGGLPSKTPPAGIEPYASFDFAGPESKVVARNITGLECTDASSDSVLVELIASEDTASDKRTEIRLRSQVFLYNRF